MMLGDTLWAIISDSYVITTAFTGLVLGALCFGLSVMPRWQDKEQAQARAEEAARAVKPIRVVELRKAA